MDLDFLARDQRNTHKISVEYVLTKITHSIFAEGLCEYFLWEYFKF